MIFVSKYFNKFITTDFKTRFISNEAFSIKNSTKYSLNHFSEILETISYLKIVLYSRNKILIIFFKYIL